MEKNKKSVLIRLEEIELLEIKTIAEVMGITPSLFYRLAIRSSLKFYKNKHLLVQNQAKPTKQELLNDEIPEEALKAMKEKMKKYRWYFFTIKILSCLKTLKNE